MKTLLILLVAATAYGSTWTDHLADAIYKAENSKTHPYGILPKYKHTTPRQACVNTIKHNVRRWHASGEAEDFIAFLGHIYCPVGANNDNGTNQYWISNVQHFMDKQGQQHNPDF